MTATPSAPSPSSEQPGWLGTGCGVFVLGAMAFILAVAVATAVDTDARSVTAGDFGGRWPLTVEDGTLACSLGQVTFLRGGIEYAVDPVAQMTSLRRIDAIRTDQPATDAKKSLDPLIHAGLDLCEP